MTTDMSDARRGQSPVVPERFSPAAIDCYRTCPARFLRKYVLKEESEATTSTPLAIGNAVHACLNVFFGLPAEQRCEENLRRSLISVWRDHCPPGLFANRDDERANGLRCIDMLQRYGQHHDLGAQTLAREQWVQTRLQNGTVVFGKIDRLDPLGGEGGVEIRDYKTGGRNLNDEDLPRQTAVRIYVLGTQARSHKLVERVTFHYLLAGDDVSWNVEQDDLEAWTDALVEITNAIRADQAFEATPGDQCRFCPFAFDCQAHQQTRLEDLTVPDDLPF